MKILVRELNYIIRIIDSDIKIKFSNVLYKEKYLVAVACVE